MRFEGRVIKHGTNWLVEIPAFDAMTQARTKEEAYEMAQDLIEMMASSRGFRVTVYPREKKRSRSAPITPEFSLRSC